MGLVNVRNRNTYQFTQKFKGKMVTIPPGQAIQMDREEAVEFRGQFSPIKLDKHGAPSLESAKMIFIEELEGSKSVTVERHIHPLTGKEYASKKALQAALEETKDQTFTDELAEQEITQMSAEVKRGRGRPSKNAGANT